MEAQQEAAEPQQPAEPQQQAAAELQQQDPPQQQGAVVQQQAAAELQEHEPPQPRETYTKRIRKCMGRNQPALKNICMTTTVLLGIVGIVSLAVMIDRNGREPQCEPRPLEKGANFGNLTTEQPTTTPPGPIWTCEEMAADFQYMIHHNQKGKPLRGYRDPKMDEIMAKYGSWNKKVSPVSRFKEA